MRTRTLIVLLIGLAALSAATVMVVRAQQRQPAIASSAIGTWTEVGGSPPQRMTIVKTGVDRYAVHYSASDVGSYADPATLEGDHLQVWGENMMSAPLYQIHYDETRDQVIVRRNGATVRLERTL